MPREEKVGSARGGCRVNPVAVREAQGAQNLWATSSNKFFVSRWRRVQTRLGAKEIAGRLESI
jgi:hypothetical protein